MRLELVGPERRYLAGYRAALGQGWSPNTARDVSAQQAAAIDADPEGFLRDLMRQGGPHIRIDGVVVERMPHWTRWLWDGEFCGVINLRWQHGTEELPPLCFGHVGYAVVPWKRRRGYATEALRQALAAAIVTGLRRLKISTDHDNLASQRVIEANGGRHAGDYPDHGQATPKRLYIVDLPR